MSDGRVVTDVNIEFKLPTDDFYLQWEHIYLWQFKFNLLLLIQEEFKKLGVEPE